MKLWKKRTIMRKMKLWKKRTFMRKMRHPRRRWETNHHHNESRVSPNTSRKQRLCPNLIKRKTCLLAREEKTQTAMGMKSPRSKEYTLKIILVKCECRTRGFPFDGKHDNFFMGPSCLVEVAYNKRIRVTTCVKTSQSVGCCLSYLHRHPRSADLRSAKKQTHTS